MAISAIRKVVLVHPAGKRGISMELPKYELLKKIILGILKEYGALTHSELLLAVETGFRKAKVRFEGSVGWNMEWVKLDLEAKGIVERIKTNPLKFALKRK